MLDRPIAEPFERVIKYRRSNIEAAYRLGLAGRYAEPAVMSLDLGDERAMALARGAIPAHQIAEMQEEAARRGKILSIELALEREDFVARLVANSLVDPAAIEEPVALQGYLVAVVTRCGFGLFELPLPA